MARNNKSFFERLTGTINLNNNERQPAQEPHHEPVEDHYDDFEQEFTDHDAQVTNDPHPQEADPWGQPDEQIEDEGELAVDVYETPDEVVVQTMVAGVRPDHLDVSISRETCTISGRREAPRDVPAEDYFAEELYWGSFSRSVTLPSEVEVEEAEANEDHGLLTIRLPKVNKDREMKLEVQ